MLQPGLPGILIRWMPDHIADDKHGFGAQFASGTGWERSQGSCQARRGVRARTARLHPRAFEPQAERAQRSKQALVCCELVVQRHVLHRIFRDLRHSGGEQRAPPRDLRSFATGRACTACKQQRRAMIRQHAAHCIADPVVRENRTLTAVLGGLRGYDPRDGVLIVVCLLCWYAGLLCAVLLCWYTGLAC